MTDNERLMKAGSVRLAVMVLTSSLIIVLAMGCAGDYARQRAETYYLHGQALVNRGETDRAIKKFEKSIYLSEKTGFEAGIAHNLNELAIIHTTRGEFEKARSELNRAYTNSFHERQKQRIEQGSGHLPCPGHAARGIQDAE